VIIQKRIVRCAYNRIDIKKYFLDIQESFKSVKQNNKILQLLIILCLVLGISLSFFLNKTVFLVSASTIFLLCGLLYKRITDLDLKFDYSEPINFCQFYDDVIKVSAVISESDSEVLNYLNNYSTYKEWNKYLIGILDIKKDIPMNATYRYYKSFNESDGDMELKVMRKKHFNTLIDYLEGNEIMRVIVIETGKNRTKVSIFLPLVEVSKGKLPITLVKSTLKSLDLLNLYISTRNFSKDVRNESRRYTDANSEADDMQSICSFETRKKSNAIYRKSRTIGGTDRPTGLSDIQTIPEEPIIRQDESKDIKPFEAKPLDPIELENQEIRKLCEDKMNGLGEYFNRPWKVLEEKNGYKLFYFDEKSGLRSIRAEITINKPIKEIYDYLQIFEKKGLYDKNFDNGKQLRAIDDNYSIDYLKYKGKLMISPRDFVIVSHKEIKPDEAFIFATNYENVKYPKNKGIERADLKFGYFHMRKLEDSKTYFTFYTLVYYNITVERY
jgi:hypothetical protein